MFAACHQGHLSVIKWLIFNGARFRSNDDDGEGRYRYWANRPDHRP